MQQLKPAEILEVTIQSRVNRAAYSFRQLIMLGFLAGAFISLAGAGANMAGFYFLADPATSGIGRMISGIIFPSGLIMVFLAGGELFTGNNMMIAAVLDKKISISSMLRNWLVVYLANLISSMIIAWLIVYSGMLNAGDGLLNEVTVGIAVSKVSLSFGQAFVRAIFCNFLVCLAVWIANGADSTIGKIFGIFFPILLFVTAGFEHSVANMFSIPIGIFADSGATAGLTWTAFLVNNLLPVTLGNIAGGGFFVTGTYYLAYKRYEKA